MYELACFSVCLNYKILIKFLIYFMLYKIIEPRTWFNSIFINYMNPQSDPPLLNLLYTLLIVTDPTFLRPISLPRTVFPRILLYEYLRNLIFWRKDDLCSVESLFLVVWLERTMESKRRKLSHALTLYTIVYTGWV